MIDRPLKGDVFYVVTRDIILFIGLVMFLINDDDAKIGKRQEDGTSGADNDAYFLVFDALVLFVAFLIG